MTKCTSFCKATFFSILLLFSLPSADAAIYLVSNKNISGTGSIGDAINLANSNTGLDTIQFNIAGPEVQVISVYSALPCLTDNAGVFMDGYSQPGSAKNTNGPGLGNNAVLKIMLKNTATVSTGLCLNSDYNKIEGLIITDFNNGSTLGYGLNIGGAAASSQYNYILGCFIGVDSTGKNAGTLQKTGIYLGSNGHNNYIGDGTPGGNNLISGNTDFGINIFSNGSFIKGNFIGIDRDGVQKPASGSQNKGIKISASNNTIGGVQPADRNTISCNTSTGIELTANVNYVYGNFIGLKADGSASAGNQKNGIEIAASSNYVGGITTGEGNVISGNTQNGILFSNINNTASDNNKIWGNKIGTDVTGSSSAGNGWCGIQFDGSGATYNIQQNQIGGITNSNEPNIIAFNDTGIKVMGGIGNNFTRYNHIRRNSIHSNTKVGIILLDDGNDLKSPPSISYAVACGAAVTIEGTSAPGDTVEIFKGDTIQGKTYIDYIVANALGGWKYQGLAATSNDTLIVTGHNNNSTAFSGYWKVDTEVMISKNKSDEQCSLNNGTATATANAGRSPYTYAWSNGGTSGTITGLSPGAYTVTVTDNSGCTVTDSVMVAAYVPLTVSVTGSTDPTCNGYTNGTATALGDGGEGTYYYEWNTTPVSYSSIVTNLSAGTYTVTISDAGICSVTNTAVIVVSEPSVLAVTTSKQNVACLGASTGSATANASGGTSPYTYLWSGSGQTTQTATGLSAGMYTVTVTDNKSCVVLGMNINITQPATALATSTTKNNVLCNAGNNGSATVTPTGGNSPYTYSWNPGVVQTTAVATALYANNYTVMVTDSNGCVKTDSALVSQPAAILIAESKTDIPCFGLNNGSATATVTGGISPYTYLWTNGQTTNPITSLSQGSYSVTITDGNACMVVSAGVFITQPASALVSTIGKTDVTVYGGSDGTATAMPTGGTSPYTYLWNTAPSQSAAIATGLSAGTFTVTVTDNNNCTATASAFINQPPAHNISGRIFRNSYADTVTSGTVYLIQHNTSNTSMGFMDTAVIAADGSYQFLNAPDDDYLILADADTITYPYAQRTYFGDSLYWNKGKILILTADTTLINISIAEMTPLTGPGRITGVIIQGAGSKKRMGPGSPVKGVKLSLNSKTTTAPMMFTESLDSGKYEFSNIPLGDYFIYADTTGIPVDISMPATVFTVDSTDTLFKNVIIYVDSNKVYMIDSTVTIVNNPSELTTTLLAIYPNPANQFLFIEIFNPAGESEKISISLMNLQGQEVRQQEFNLLSKGKNKLFVSTQGISDGIYFIRVRSPEAVLGSSRIIIIR